MNEGRSKTRRWPEGSKQRSKLEVPPGVTPVIDSPNSVVSRPNGPNAQVIQTNALSTPVFVVLILALFISALVSAVALVQAFEARSAATIAEREARLSQRRYDSMKVELELKGLKLEEIN